MKSLTERKLPVAPGFHPHCEASAAPLPFGRYRFFALLCAAIALCAVLCVVPGTALAAPAVNEPAVVYDAAAHEWHGENLQPDNVMVDFADVMPGDTLVQEFTVRADNVQSPVSLFMRRDVPDAPANTRAEAAGALDGVRYTATAGGKVVSQGALGDLAEGNTPIARFSADGALDCRIALEVPTSYGNEFQTAAYTLEWLFIAQEDGGAADGGSSGVTASTEDLLPRTGDGSMVPLVCAAAVATVLMVAALLMRRRRSA